MTFVRPKRNFYVYALVDPRDRQPFYIGKGKGKRYAAHVREWRSGKGSNYRKLSRIADIMASGLEIEIAILAENLTETVAYRIEAERIAAGNDTLTNCAPGSLSEVERAWNHANFLIGRLMRPRDWAGSFARRRGRPPNVSDVRLYRFVAKNLFKNRATLHQLMIDDQKENSPASA